MSMKRGVPLMMVLCMVVVSIGPVMGTTEEVRDVSQGSSETSHDPDIARCDEYIDTLRDDPDVQSRIEFEDSSSLHNPTQRERTVTNDPMFPPMNWVEAVMLYEDAENQGEWLPLPTREDILQYRLEPVTFGNGTFLEVHGKLFEGITSDDMSYFDDIGIPNMSIEVIFDGTTVPMHNITGNATALIGPFWEFGNGTFQFRVELSRPAGEYELVLRFNGWPMEGTQIYRRLTYVTLLNINHPTKFDAALSSSRVLAGEEVEVYGTITDDTDVPVGNAPVGIWWEDRLLGPSAQGVYIDDVEVEGANWSDDFEGKNGTWATFSASSVPNQWERGFPRMLPGPLPRSWVNLWVTRLNHYYERGAWSYLVSPIINMSEEKQYTLSFWAWWRLPWSEDMAYVVASTDYGETWDEGHAMTFTEGNLTGFEWKHVEKDVSRYSGSDHIRFAFVFLSPAKTIDTREDGSFSFSHMVSNHSDVGRYDVRVAFPGDLHFQASEDTVRISVVRNTRIELEEDPSGRVGHRNGPLVIRGRLLDDWGAPLKAEVDDHEYYYFVSSQWPWKGWTIDDYIGDPLFSRSSRVDPESGEFEIRYVVDANHELGPLNVSLRFSGDDFYNGVQVVEEFYVKAHLQVTVPSRENRTFHRGQTVYLGPDLHIVPSESREDRENGDPVTGVYVKVYWNGQIVSTRRTTGHEIDDNGFLIPSDHPLGEVIVTYEYEGNITLEAFTQSITFFIVSDTFITLEDRSVVKGTWVTISGTITDDRWVPLSGASVYIIWKRAPEIGRATSDSSGRFSLQYYIEYEDRVGNITVIARFKGDGRYLSGESKANYTIQTNTVLDRRDRVINLLIESPPMVTYILREEDAWRYGSGIAQEEVTLTIDGVFIDSKRTTSIGYVTFDIPMESLSMVGGYVELVATFNGTELYLPCKDVSTLFIKVDQVTTLQLEGDGGSLTPGVDVVRRNDTVRGLVTVMNETNVLWSGRKVSILTRNNLDPSTDRLFLEGVTDGDGTFEFSLMLQSDSGGEVSLGVISPGMSEAIWHTFKYIVPPSPSDKPIFIVEGDREVRAGSELELRLRVRNEDGWETDRLDMSLVSPPEGMVISSDGTITWTPTNDQVGEHTVTIWLYDGDRSETGTLAVTVVEAPSWTESLVKLVGAMMIVLVVGLAIMVIFARWARRRAQ
jgi:hypothetical protein